MDVLRERAHPGVEQPGGKLEPSELRQLVDGVRFIERMQASPVDKNAAAGETAALRTLFTKTVVARIDLPAGTRLRAEHLAAKKPGTGIPAARLPELVGARLERSVRADELLADVDLRW